MKQIKVILIVLVSVSISFCSKKNVVDHITFDSSFKGARLNKVEIIGNNKFIAHINPASEPVNKSPYFAFSITAKSEKENRTSTQLW